MRKNGAYLAGLGLVEPLEEPKAIAAKKTSVPWVYTVPQVGPRVFAPDPLHVVHRTWNACQRIACMQCMSSVLMSRQPAYVRCADNTDFGDASTG